MKLVSSQLTVPFDNNMIKREAKIPQQKTGIQKLYLKIQKCFDFRDGLYECFSSNRRFCTDKRHGMRKFT